ncbi:phosphatase PAP2 family protein [Candidatus Woesearchaeota archaeon]|nr:phosphatase PAP2 family protein [Candidatus Woesearchaeota archaeon]
MKKSIRKLPKQFMSRKILRIILDDISNFGSIPFYILILAAMLFIERGEFFFRLFYSFLIAMALIIVIKSVHFKDRPQKEEFSIFIEKVLASSFPSSHSLNVTILAILFSLQYPFLWVMIFSGMLAVLVFLHRYISKKHFIVDIFGGILLAIIEVIFVVRVLG